MKNKTKSLLKRILSSLGIGIVAGLLAAVITSFITSILQLPNKIALPIVVVVAIALVVLLSWLIKKHPLKTLRILAIVLISLGVLIIFSSYFPSLWANIIWDPAVVGLAIGIIGVGIAYFALSISQESDKRMSAMANLEFHEKIAVIEAYVSDIYRSCLGEETSATKKERIRKEISKVNAKRIYHDVKGAKQLKEYTDPDLDKELNQEIDNLINIASKHRKQYKELIDKLNRLKQEEAAQK